ncbi:uncharacterized protein LOC131433820 [Malaya genurostris]|uniref:uncharacterized protein LOC131433820 n=1 Tax=Malaya genurostris TaxID=325434 RepID=UPI0026F3DE65|nr:uncharacterized protein LOC131433820 [Malaya genurostris]
MLRQATRQNVESYRQRRKQQTRLFRDKKRRLEESEREEMEMLYRSQDTRAFYRKLNDSRNGFMPRAEMCRDKEGGILTDEPDIGDFFNNLISAFKPETAQTNGVSSNGTIQQNSTKHASVRDSNQTEVSSTPSTIPVTAQKNIQFVNLTETGTTKSEIISTTTEPWSEVTSETEETATELTTTEEVTTNADTTIESGSSSTTTTATTTTVGINTTTVVYRLFHPNTTTTTQSTTATTVEVTNSTENTNHTDVTISVTEPIDVTSNASGIIQSSATKRDASLTLGDNSSSVTQPAVTYQLANGVSCSVSVPAGTIKLIISCSQSASNDSTPLVANTTEPTTLSSSVVHKDFKRSASIEKSVGSNEISAEFDNGSVFLDSSESIAVDDGVPVFWSSVETFESSSFENSDSEPVAVSIKAPTTSNEGIIANGAKRSPGIVPSSDIGAVQHPSLIGAPRSLADAESTASSTLQPNEVVPRARRQIVYEQYYTTEDSDLVGKDRLQVATS